MKYILLAFVFLAFMGCKTQKETTNNNNSGSGDVKGTQLKWEDLHAGSYSSIKETSVEVVNNEEDWTELWKITNKNYTPLPKMPNVNFDKYAIVAAYMGEKMSGGHSIMIEEIVAEGKTLHLKLKFKEPGANCMTTQAITSPYKMVLVKKGNYSDLDTKVRSVKEDCKSDE